MRFFASSPRLAESRHVGRALIFLREVLGKSTSRALQIFSRPGLSLLHGRAAQAAAGQSFRINAPDVSAYTIRFSSFCDSLRFGGSSALLDVAIGFSSDSRIRCGCELGHPCSLIQSDGI